MTWGELDRPHSNDITLLTGFQHAAWGYVGHILFDHQGSCQTQRCLYHSRQVDKAWTQQRNYALLIQSYRASPPNPAATPDPTQPNPGTYHDVLKSYGPLIKRDGSSTLLVLNSDLTAEEGSNLIKENKIDVALYGRPWINNPDFQHRVEQNVPLTTEMNWFGLYNFKEQPSEGYSDYPAATAWSLSMFVMFMKFLLR
jgi:2,4-dienoyl-CoA reductase-like NADH-dependent reductase (Old Yellow Enzyme family)